MLNLLAFDLGASNGRAILGQLENGKLTMKELHRFENNYIIEDGVFYWNLPHLFEQLKKAVDKINRRRRHHGGEGVSFHIALVDTTSISS